MKIQRPITENEWFDQDASHIDLLLDAAEFEEDDWEDELGL